MLQVVAGNLAFVAKGTLDAKTSRHLDLARLGLERCATLARRTLRPNAEAAIERICLLEAMTHLHRQCRQACGEGIVLAIDVEDDDLSIVADPIGFENAIINLVLNAIQAMNGQGAIGISCRAAEPLDHGGATAGRAPVVLIAVEDTGPGMPPEVASAVVERFFTTKPGGSGHGLANVRAFVEAVGGTLDIDTGLGRGTKVTLAMPVVPRLADGDPSLKR
ncbi:ATP-binding protein [Lichenihabitans sp. Uapishka_5]|uniref:sensor histidine kinase n=1 Tax=Lichenihabitans sp. Uapishka_5 TaxID=3037302 RepID=UPI0029E7FE63|nr:ATP-binding protein [Lichenihabitans sp. Uapishka_5]MDX7951821.1 ATP-binding protein [Lichenihabitans sp. Uapishka_5]